MIHTQRVYLQPDLNVKRLSELLATPEYLVRKYINEQLGFRNFNDFLNANRITRARERLTAVTSHETPITTLAFDLGYQSLATFNRAFRQYCGQSPSEFRKKQNCGATSV